MSKLPNAFHDLPYVDLPELQEIFADSVGSMSSFDRSTVRVELTVARMDKLPHPEGRKPSGKRYPVARLALTYDCARDLAGFLNRWLEAVEKNPEERAGTSH
jgi:hypothetical protein